MRRFLVPAVLASLLFPCRGALASAWVIPKVPEPVSLANARTGHTLTVLPNGNIVAIGGQSGASYLASVEIFVSSKSGWMPARPMNTQRAFHTATLLGTGNILVTGGVNGGGSVSSVELYLSTANQWVVMTPLTNQRQNHTATLLQDGTVLVVGGNNGATFPATPELYNPASGIPGTWTQLTTPINQPRTKHTASLLPNGNVIVAGGLDSAGNFLNSTEIYLAANQTWTVSQPLSIGRYGHQATVLGTGDVLFTGGFQSPNGGNGTQFAIFPPFIADGPGYSATNEIYRFAGDRIDTASPLPAYTALHVAARLADGTVVAAGGQGTVDDFQFSGSFSLGGNLTVTTPFPKALSGTVSGTVTFTSGTFNLASSHSGAILGGQLALGTFQITFASGTMTLSGTGDLSGIPVNNRGLMANLTVPVSGTVSLTTSPVNNPVVFQNGGVGTSLGGAILHVSSMVFSDSALFNPNTETWSLETSTTQLTAYSQAAVVAPNGDVFVAGGSDPTGAALPNALLRVALDQRSQVGPTLNTARSGASATVLPDGRVLVAGGSVSTSALSACEIYNPSTGLFTPTGSLSVPRKSHTATLLPDGRVLVAGGFTSGASTGALPSAEIYYPVSGVWHPTGSMTTARTDHTATLLPNGNILAAGGHAQGPDLRSSEIYNSTGGFWTAAGTMNTARSFHTANLMTDGTVLVAGGLQTSGANQNILASAESYNYQTNLWTPLNPMGTGVVRHTATTLPGGDLLVTGGDTAGGAISATQLYNHLTGIWAGAGDMGIINARFSHTATLLPNGNVLICGGANSLGSYLRSCTLADPLNATGLLNPANGFGIGRSEQAQVLLPSNILLTIGGRNSADLVGTELQSYSEYSGAALVPSINSLSGSAFTPGQSITVLGSNFTAGLEQGLPQVALQPFDTSSGVNARSSAGGFLLDLSSVVYTASTQWSNISSSMTFNLPASTTTMAPGWYALRMVTNGLASTGAALQIGPPKPTAAPTSLTSTVMGTSSATFTWAAVPGVNGYHVYSATTSDIIAILPSTQTSFTWTGHQPNTPLQISVAGFTLLGDAQAAQSSTVYTLTLPASGLSIVDTAFTFIDVKWTSPNINAIDELSYSSDNFTSSLTTTTVFAHTSSGTLTANAGALAENTQYYFRVRTLNSAGVGSSYTVIVSSFTNGHLKGVSGSAVDTADILWNWPAVGSALFYEVISTSGSVVIGTTSATSFLETGLSTNTPYGVVIGAVTSGGLTTLSDAATAYSLAAPPFPSPAGFTAVSQSSFTMAFSLNGNPFNTAITLELSSDGFSSINQSKTFSSTFPVSGYTYTWPTLIPNTLYSVRARAANGDGVKSAAVPMGSTSTFAAAPSAFQIASVASSLNVSSVTLTWDNSNNPIGFGNSVTTQYQVVMSTDNFNLNISTPIPFGTIVATAAVNSPTDFTMTAAIGGLVGGTTYGFRVSARNQFLFNSGFAQISTTTPVGVVTSFAGVASSSQGLSIAGVFPSLRQVSLSVPPGAYAQPVQMTVQELTTGGCGSIPAGFQIDPAPLLQPVLPSSVTLTFLASDIASVNASQLTLVRIDPVSGGCVPIPTLVDLVRHTATGVLNHFSQYQLMAVAPQSDLSLARVFPNPFYASRGQSYVTFDRLTSDGHVQIYTLTGDLVYDVQADASGVAVWPGWNSAGNPVASGIYLALIRSSSGKRVVKLAVIR